MHHFYLLFHTHGCFPLMVSLMTTVDPQYRYLLCHLFGKWQMKIAIRWPALNREYADGRGCGDDMTDSQVKFLIVTALKSLHGETGAALGVDLLRWRPRQASFILRSHRDSMVRVRSALVVITRQGDRLCAVRVDKASSFLPDLVDVPNDFASASVS